MQLCPLVKANVYRVCLTDSNFDVDLMFSYLADRTSGPL